MVVSTDHSSHTHVKSSATFLALIFETERVNSVWTTEKLGLAWIALNILPTRVGPSARNELKVLLWDAVIFLILLFYVAPSGEPTCLLRFASVLRVLASTEILRTASLFLNLHCLSKQTSKKLHYNLINLNDL